MSIIEATTPTQVELNRRQLLAALAGLGAAGIAGWPSRMAAALSAATFKQGTFEVTVVSDGHLVLPTNILAPDAPAEELKALLAAAGVTGDKVEPATNAVILRSGSDVILFDTGSGTDFQPTAGKLLENLKAEGIDPASITKVVFTHAHPDHALGTIGKSGASNFPNATFYIAEAEWNFWMDKDLKTKMPKEMHPFVDGAQKHLGGIKDRVTALKPGGEVVTGIVMLDATGHTPGHAAFEIAGDGGLVIMGDTAPVPAVHFVHPEWRFGFDGIPALAIQNRKKLLDRAASEKLKLQGFHWAYPGVGHAEKKDAGYVYVPAA